MTNLWATVTALGLLVIFIALFLTPTAFFVVYVIGGALAASGPTVAVLHILDRRNHS